MIRIHSITISVLLFLATSFGQDIQLKKVNFLPLWFPQPQFAGYYMAKEKGFYKDQGLDVNILTGGYGKDVTEMLENGEVDFGLLHLSTAIKKNSLGSSLVNIGQIFQKSGLVFVSKKSRGIKNIKDFNNKKIAVWRTVFTEEYAAFFKKHEIQAEILKINEGVNLLLKDAVDICLVMNYNEYNSLYYYGIDYDEMDVFYFDDYGMDIPEDGIYCTEETWKSDPETSKKFVDASLTGWEYAIQNPEETLKVLKRIQEENNVMANLAHSEWMMESMPEMLSPMDKETNLGNLKRSEFENTINVLLETGEIENQIQYDGFYKGHRK